MADSQGGAPGSSLDNPIYTPGDIDVSWSKPISDGQAGNGGSAAITTVPPAPAGPARAPAARGAPAQAPANDTGFDPSLFGDAIQDAPAATGALGPAVPGAPAAAANDTGFDPSLFGDALVPESGTAPAPAYSPAPAPAPEKYSDWSDVIAKGAGQAVAGTINTFSDPMRNLITDPVSSVAIELHNRLAPLWGGDTMSPQQEQDTRDAVKSIVNPFGALYDRVTGAQAPAAGTPQIGDEVADKIRAAAGKVPFSQIEPDTLEKKLVQGAVAGAGSSIPMLPLMGPGGVIRGLVKGIASGALSGVGSQVGQMLAPADMQNTGNILGGVIGGSLEKSALSGAAKIADLRNVTPIDPDTGQPFRNTVTGEPIKAQQGKLKAASDANVAASGMSAPDLSQAITDAQSNGPQVPGAQNTLGQITSNEGLMRRERLLRAQGANDRFAAQASQNNAARRNYVPGQSDEPVDYQLPGQIFSRRLAELRTVEDAANQVASIDPRALARDLGLPDTPETRQVLGAHIEEQLNSLKAPMEALKNKLYEPLNENEKAIIPKLDYGEKIKNFVQEELQPGSGRELDEKSPIAKWLQAAKDVPARATVKFWLAHLSAISEIQRDLSRAYGPGIAVQEAIANGARNILENHLDAAADFQDQQVAKGQRAPENHFAGTNVDLAAHEKARLDAWDIERGPRSDIRQITKEQQQAAKRPVPPSGNNFVGKTPTQVYAMKYGQRPTPPNEESAVQHLISLGGFRDLDRRAANILQDRMPRGDYYEKRDGAAGKIRRPQTPLVNPKAKMDMTEAARSLADAGYFPDYVPGEHFGPEPDLVSKLEDILTKHANGQDTHSIDYDQVKQAREVWDANAEHYERSLNDIDAELADQKRTFTDAARHKLADDLFHDPDLTPREAIRRYDLGEETQENARKLYDIEREKGNLTNKEFDQAIVAMRDGATAEQAHQMARDASVREYLNGVAPITPPSAKPETVAGVELQPAKPAKIESTPGMPPGATTPPLFRPNSKPGAPGAVQQKFAGFGGGGGGGGGGEPPNPPGPEDMMTPAMRASMKAAREQYRKIAQTFGPDTKAGVVGDVLASGRTSEGYKILRENVPGKVFNTSPAAADALMKAASGDPDVAMRVLGNVPARSFMDAAFKNGKFDVAGAQKWINNHKEYMDKIPGLADQFSTVANAMDTAQKAVAEAVTQRKAFENGVASMLLGKDGEPLMPRQAIERVAQSAQAGPNTTKILDHLRAEGGEVAVNAWKQNLADYYLEKTSLSTGSGAGDDRAMGMGRVDRLANDPRIEAMMEATFGPEEARRIQTIQAHLLKATKLKTSFAIQEVPERPIYVLMN